MSTNSRRDFLKTASATAAAMAVTNNVAAWGAQGSQAPPVSPVKVWSTYRDKRHAAGEPLQWKQASQIAADAIALNPEATKQEILGFGGALTDATCYMISQLKES